MTDDADHYEIETTLDIRLLPHDEFVRLVEPQPHRRTFRRILCTWICSLLPSNRGRHSRLRRPRVDV